METANSFQGQTFKDFQTTASVKDKREKGYGKIVAKHIERQVFGSDSAIFARNIRYKKNRDWANGRINVQTMFQDWLELNGKTNYVNLNWKALSIVNTIVSRLVGRWMARNEKIMVTATDTLSITQKNDEYEQIEFELRYRQELQELQEHAGVPLVPQNQFQAQDMEELELWRAELQRLPEEILYETNCNDALAANGFFDTLKEKCLHDSAVTGFVGTYTWMDEEGVIHVDLVKPENAFYSYSEFPDFRDTAWRGRVVSMKLTELRRKYGSEFGGELTEQQIFEIAATAKEFQYNDKISWVDTWNYTAFRPYDDWNIDVMEFELKTLDGEGYTVTQTKANKSTLIKKGKPEKLQDNQQYVEDKKWNIYRGVYFRGTDLMLEWGVKKNMIRPQDPKEIGNCEFSYSFYMYQNHDMRNLAIPEKIEAAVEQMILVTLKIQQIVAKMTPPGAAINIDALQELDLGLATATTPSEAVKIWQQAGMLYYRGRDAEGNPIPLPVNELPNTGFSPQMEALMKLYQFHYNVLKDELGEDPNLITQAATPRVSEGNIQTSIQQADFATGYIYASYVSLLEETSKKMACLMKNSVQYGARAYRHIMKQEDVKNRVFGTKIQLLPTEQELQNLQAQLNQAVVSTPDLVLYMDTFKILRVAKENLKLAEQLFRNGQKKMLQGRAEQASKNTQETANVQIQSAQAKQQGDAQLEQMKNDLAVAKEAQTIKGQKEVALLTAVLDMYKTNGAVPPELQPITMSILQNVAVPVVTENHEMQQQIISAMQQQQMQAQQMAQQQQQAPPPNQQQLPPPNSQPEPEQQMQPEMAA